MSTSAIGGAGAAEICPAERVLRFDNALRRVFYDPAEMFGPYVRPGMAVMDVGCGAGFNSLGLARLVGDRGRVLAVDVQPELLAVLEARAAAAGLLRRISTRPCRPDDVGVRGPVDFVNAFWMVHETPDVEGFLRQVHALLRPGGRLFVAEPWFHVSAAAFEAMVRSAEALGLRAVGRPRVWFSRAVVLRRRSDAADAPGKMSA